MADVTSRGNAPRHTGGATDGDANPVVLFDHGWPEAENEVMLQHLQILQDWTRVDDLEVANSEYRTFEYHVVADQSCKRVTLTIKCLNADATVRRLDPNNLGPHRGEPNYRAIAEERVRQLYDQGRI